MARKREDESSADPRRGVDTQCAWNDYGARCAAKGVLSDSTDGSGPWYCREHEARRTRRQPPNMAPYQPEDLSSYGLGKRLPGETEREYGRRSLVYMRNGMARLLAGETGRQREWAVRIQDRYADRDLRISELAFRLACEALGQEAELVAVSIRPKDDDRR